MIIVVIFVALIVVSIFISFRTCGASLQPAPPFQRGGVDDTLPQLSPRQPYAAVLGWHSIP